MYVYDDISVCRRRVCMCVMMFRRRVCMCVMTINFKFSSKYCCVRRINMTESTLNYHCH